MNINLLSQPQRSPAAVRRALVRCFVSILVTVMVGGLTTSALCSMTRSLQSRSGRGIMLGAESLSSHVATCRAEQDSLQRLVATVRESCLSWRRPKVIFDGLTTALPSEIWLQEVSIQGSEVELVGVARSADDIERLMSSPQLLRALESARIVSTRSERADGGRVFQVSALAPVSSTCRYSGEVGHARE